MARTPTALSAALDGVMENSALAMEEQRLGLRLLGYARRHLHTLRRHAATDGLIDARERDEIREATILVQGCECALALDVRDEEQLRDVAGGLDGYIVERNRHQKHTDRQVAVRAHTLTV